MTIGDLIRRWIESNREFARTQALGRAVTHQSRFKTSEIYDEVHSTFDPVFVLSTGRTGTKLLVKILETHSGVEAFHEPAPGGPDYYSTFAYRRWQSHYDEVKTAVDCMRYQLIRDVFLSGKKYVEANNRITFFAHQLADLYPRSRFLHLVREPRAFVRSGIARGWYSDEVITDEGRISPDEDQSEWWGQLSDAGRIAWLWNETNQFVESFKEGLEPDRHLTVKSEDLFSDPEAAQSVFELIGVESTELERLQKVIAKPVNRQRPATMKELSSGQLEEVASLTPLARSYYGETP